MRQSWKSYWVLRAVFPAFALWACARPAPAQSSSLLTVAPPQKITLKRDATAEVKLAVELRSGYHVNSNTPSEDYLIPLKLTWQPGGLRALDIVYPKPRLENYEFSEKPVSVFTGNFEIVTKFKSEPKADAGPGILAGKLRYQACNNTTCFPPKTVDIKLPFSIQ